MECWQILGIEPTADEGIIKKAYAKALRQNKPDVNPEGFKRVRLAYEQALENRYFYDDDDDEETEIEYIAVNKDGIDDKGIDDKINGDDNAVHLIVIDKSNHQTIHHSFDETALDSIDDKDKAEIPINKTPISPPVFLEKVSIEPYHIETPPPLPSLPTVEHLCDAWYQIINDDTLTFADKDEQLYQLLQQQKQDVFYLPLDEKSDYETSLLLLFAHQEVCYVSSFYFAFSSFDWQSVMDSWQIDRYPWYYLSNLQERYQHQKIIHHINLFNNRRELSHFLAENYPTLHGYYNEQVQTYRPLKYFCFFLKQSIQPIILKSLSDELKEFNDLINQTNSSISDNNLMIKLLKDDKLYQLLNLWVFKGVFPVAYIAIFSVFALGLLMLMSLMVVGDLSIVTHFILPIWVFLMALLLFWQWRFQLFVNPENFSYQPLTYFSTDYEKIKDSLKISLPIIFATMIYGSYNRLQESLLQEDGGTLTAYDRPSYFFMHLFCFGFWYSLFRSNRYHDPEIIEVHWSLVFALLMLTLFYPMIGVLFDNPDLKENILAVPFWFWLVAYLPIVEHLLVTYRTKHNADYGYFANRICFSCGYPVVVLLTAYWSIVIAFKNPMVGIVLMVGYYLAAKSIRVDDN